MNAKEAINSIKVLLGLETEATPEEVQFAEETLVDGTVVRTEGDLEAGKALMVVTEEGEVPAPDGAHETSGGLIITTESGVIVSVEEKVADEAPAEEPAAEAEVVVEAEAEADLEVEVESEDTTADFAQEIANIISPALDEIKSLKDEINSLKSEFSSFKDEPATKKITNNLQDYKNTANSAHEARFAALKEIRKAHFNK